MSISWQEQTLEGEIGDEVDDRSADRFGLELALCDLRRCARVLSSLALKGLDRGYEIVDVQDPVEDVIAAAYRAVEALTKVHSS